MGGRTGRGANPGLGQYRWHDIYRLDQRGCACPHQSSTPRRQYANTLRYELLHLRARWQHRYITSAAFRTCLASSGSCGCGYCENEDGERLRRGQDRKQAAVRPMHLPPGQLIISGILVACSKLRPSQPTSHQNGQGRHARYIDTVRLKTIGNEIIKNIGKSESCTVSK